MNSGMFRVAADIGGTFTDIVIQDSVSGECEAVKVLSTPEEPAAAVIKGIDAAIPPEAAIDFFVHGTTVGLNALLTRTGAKVALLTTENFRDIYTIQGNDRGEIFSIRWNKPEPLVPLEHTYTVGGRISGRGEEVDPLRLSDLDTLVEAAKSERYQAIAICLLFSFKNPSHELAVEKYLGNKLPGVAIGLSHRVSPEWREFERTSTTVMHSYLVPVIRTYLEILVGKLKGRLPEGHGIHVMESNGGIMTAATASQAPLQTLLSGPVGGAIGGRALSEATGIDNMICIDMGGTSFDASLIIDGMPSASSEAMIEGLPVQMAVVDIHVIGAGGGSIAWKEAGAVRVGPQSAGSLPGPVCYGLGGELPTVSDANLVLGRLDSSNFSDDKIKLDAAAASRALAAMGEQFGMDAAAMAQGVVDIINAKMADAIRTITIKSGIDPREFVLVAFGGAGPSQAAALAESLEIGEVLVPVHPGAFSAWGMLQTDRRHDFKETYYSFLDMVEPDALEASFARLEESGRADLIKEGIAEAKVEFERSADFRYHGQEYVLTIPFPAGTVDLAAVRDRFDAAYLRQYGHNSPEARVEMTNIRLAVVGRVQRPVSTVRMPERAKPPRYRQVYFEGTAVDTAILDRAGIKSGALIEGPAIIEEGTATTLLPPGWTIRMIDGGHLSMKSGASD